MTQPYKIDPESPNAPAMVRRLLKDQEYHSAQVVAANTKKDHRQALRHAKVVASIEAEIKLWRGEK